MRNIRHWRATLPLIPLACVGIAAGCSDHSYEGIQPAEIIVAAVPPPPISGGTMAFAKDGSTAIAADPDRDVVWIVDIKAATLKQKVALEPGDEPGRVAIDEAGRAHVALRSGGALATIDIASGKVLERRAVCPSPRGVAYDPSGDRVHVACEGGELVTFPAATGAPTRVLHLDRDLRDIVVQNDKLIVTRFRSAEVLVVGPEGKIWQRETPPGADGEDPLTGNARHFEPSVAWRMVARPNGGAFMVHQRSVTTPVVVTIPGTYTGGGVCNGSVVHSTVTEIDTGDTSPTPIQIPKAIHGSFANTALPVDVAVAPNGSEMAIVSAGSQTVVRASFTNLPTDDSFDCGPPETTVPGQPIAAAFGDNNLLAVQLREPAAIYLPATNLVINLPGESRRDTGHDLFHLTPAGTGSDACASCHPEGNDDHRTWTFEGVGPRRTLSIRGGILSTAPLHWDGDLQDMGHLMDEVFVRRMGGPSIGARSVRALSNWVDKLPVLPNAAPADMSAVERGEALFMDAKVGCAKCHSGAKLTNNDSVDVGTGRKFQVPTLMGIVDRAPYMHSGCAATLRDRFDPNNVACNGGDKHGVTSHLTSEQIDDLVAYLETL